MFKKKVKDYIFFLCHRFLESSVGSCVCNVVSYNLLFIIRQTFSTISSSFHFLLCTRLREKRTRSTLKYALVLFVIVSSCPVLLLHETCLYTKLQYYYYQTLTYYIAARVVVVTNISQNYFSTLACPNIIHCSIAQL